MAEDFDAMEVCCETVVTCVEPEICDCLFSRFIFVVFPCGFNVLSLCLAGCSNGFLGELSLCFLLYKSLDCFKIKWCLFVLKCGSFFFACRSAVLLPCIPTCEAFCPVCRGVLLFLLFLLLFELWPVCLKLRFVWQI